MQPNYLRGVLKRARWVRQCKLVDGIEFLTICRSQIVCRTSTIHNYGEFSALNIGTAILEPGNRQRH